jgi:hypothetical protein
MMRQGDLRFSVFDCRIRVIGVFLVCLVVFSGVGVGYQLKVDLCFGFPEPDAGTWKGSDPGFEDWIPWAVYPDSEPHDARDIYDVGGSGINFGNGGSRLAPPCCHLPKVRPAA